MKTKLLTILMMCFAFVSQAQITAPQPSPTAKVEQVVGLTDITLEYSRPSLRGRSAFGELVPFGQTWRTGANANTKITFGTDVTIDGKKLAKGTYALFTVPNANSWDVIFYNDATNWGTPQKWDDSKVALKTSAKPSTLANKVETFTIDFSDLGDFTYGHLNILWDKTAVAVKIEVPTDELTSASIQKVMAGPDANDYFNAASYYRKSGKSLDQAKTWIDKAVAMRPEAFWYMREQSLIYAAMGDKNGAIIAAKNSLASAQKAGNQDYVKMNQDSIAEWSK
ncbi:DUF2911 domain-containing protein [Namhaeicola litoreus]|uniref:DUF2911 domain-containing protein n=1 Tax=Namhaeicola litoreus TaxID=1052145 RepID=A0ABW3Y640_9FLAO